MRLLGHFLNLQAEAGQHWNSTVPSRITASPPGLVLGPKDVNGALPSACPQCLQGGYLFLITCYSYR